MKLHLYCVHDSPRGGDLYRVTDNTWQELTVTWNTALRQPIRPVATLGAVA